MDCLSGIEHIHKQGYIHRDIKAANILLTREGRAALSDFGVAGTLTEAGFRRRGRHTLTGTGHFF